MNKEQLQKKIGELEGQNKEWGANDELIRRNLSQFLGSFQNDYYSHQKEVKILRWSEIYFELGKLMLQQKRLDYVEDVENLKLETRRLNCEIEEMKLKDKNL